VFNQKTHNKKGKEEKGERQSMLLSEAIVAAGGDDAIDDIQQRLTCLPEPLRIPVHAACTPSATNRKPATSVVFFT